MKSYLQITNDAEFEQVINSLEQSYNKIKDIFQNQKRNAEEINGTDTWTGATAEVMYNKYKQLSDNFSPIEYSLELYIKFLRKTLEDYRRLIQEIDKNVDANDQALDVES